MNPILIKLVVILRHRSTYKAIVALLAIAGVAVSPELQEAITNAGIAIYDVLSVLLPNIET